MSWISSTKITNSWKIRAYKWLDNDKKTWCVICFNFRKIFSLYPQTFKARTFEQPSWIIALLVQFKSSSLTEAETMTYRIKTWANNIPILGLQSLDFLKSITLHMSLDLPLLHFLCWKIIFTAFIFVVWENVDKWCQTFL